LNPSGGGGAYVARIYHPELPYPKQIPLEEVSPIMNEDLKPPQSYSKLDHRKHLGTAISIAALLQDHLRNFNPLLLPTN
jgi:hypothetical protein